MNQNNSKSLHQPILGSFEPIEDLLYYDCPYVFTFRDADDRLAIAYLSEMDNGHSRYLAVPISDAKLNALKSGTVPLRSAFAGQIWDIQLDASATITSVVRKPSDQVAPSALPPADLLL